MKTCTLVVLIGFTLFTPPLFAETAVTSPPIPEEARKHFVFVAGTALFKNARTHDDFLEVQSEFKQAIDES